MRLLTSRISRWIQPALAGVLCWMVLGLFPAAGCAEVTPEELAAVEALETIRVQAIAKVYDTVVAIYGDDRQGGGSGVLFDRDGYVLTNYHVISSAGEQGWAGLAGGKLYRWQLLGFDPGGDLAIIKLLSGAPFPAAELGDSRQVQVGDWAMAMGNPFTLAEDQSPTVTLGIVSAVERYQPGAGKNALVYGNCIQVDSSINPGNSGGPLFNLQGQVIGINGRASFEERGRVNVGVGYAISAEQAKNFLPDLLATKICMHGTLDAIFSERQGIPVCTRLNLDASVAKQGLRLGDRLTAFAGEPIRDVNHFTNLVSTLPADWPVRIDFERDQKPQTAWLRLEGLPYEKRLQAAAEDSAPDRLPEESEEDSPLPLPERSQPKVDPSAAIHQSEPGAIRNESLNRFEASRIIQQYKKQQNSVSAEPSFGGTATVQFLGSDDATVYEARRWTWDQDGRFTSEQLEPRSGAALGIVYGYSGNSFWHKSPGGAVIESKQDFDAQRDEHLALSLFAALSQPKPEDSLQELELLGGDLVAGERAFHLRAVLPRGEPVHLWFSTTYEQGQLEPRLLKVARETSPKLADSGGWLVPAWPQLQHAYNGQAVPLFQWSEGLQEVVVKTIAASKLEFFHQPTSVTQFEVPANAKPSSGS